MPKPSSRILLASLAGASCFWLADAAATPGHGHAHGALICDVAAAAEDTPEPVSMRASHLLRPERFQAALTTIGCQAGDLLLLPQSHPSLPTEHRMVIAACTLERPIHRLGDHVICEYSGVLRGYR